MNSASSTSASPVVSVAAVVPPEEEDPSVSEVGAVDEVEAEVEAEVDAEALALPSLGSCELVIPVSLALPLSLIESSPQASEPRATGVRDAARRTLDRLDTARG